MTGTIGKMALAVGDGRGHPGLGSEVRPTRLAPTRAIRIGSGGGIRTRDLLGMNQSSLLLLYAAVVILLLSACENNPPPVTSAPRAPAVCEALRPAMPISYSGSRDTRETVRNVREANARFEAACP